MPIYAYKCGSCGYAKDVLQKLSDAPLTVCTACGAEAFSKQLTAAGFQLKGSGWYVTDFRGGNTAPSESAKSEGGADAAAPATTAESAATGTAGTTADAPKKDAPRASDSSAASTTGSSSSSTPSS